MTNAGKAGVLTDTPDATLTPGGRGIWTSEGAGYIVTKLCCWLVALAMAFLVSHKVIGADEAQTVGTALATALAPVLMGLGAMGIEAINQYKWTHSRTALKIAAVNPTAASAGPTEVETTTKATTGAATAAAARP